MSLYDDLGVGADASQDDIAEAYRRLAKRDHPDAGGDADAFARIGHAVAVLRNAERRTEYDASGREVFTEASPDARSVAILHNEFGAAFDQFITGEMAPTTDLVGIVKRALDTALLTQRGELNKVRGALGKVADAQNRITYRGDGHNLIETMLAAKAKHIEQVKGQMAAQITDIERARELADGWTWRADAPPQYRGQPMTIQKLMQSGGYVFGGAGGYVNKPGV